MTPLTEAAALVAALAAGVAGLLYLLGRARAAARQLDIIGRLVDRELTHNGGSSMKDDLHGIAVAVGELSRTTDDHTTALAALDARLDAAEAAARRHHPEG